MNGGLTYALFVFWVCGSFSVLLDLDHIWTLFKRVCPVRLSESYGRPLHTRVVFSLVSCLVGIVVVTFANGLYAGILRQFGEGGANLLFLILILSTFVLAKYLGKRLFKRLVKTRWTWRHKTEKPKNVR